MKIAMMSSGREINGVAIHVWLLTKYLLSRGHQVLLMHRPQAKIADLPGLAGAEFFETSFSRSPSELVRVTKRLNAFEPDVLHTHMSSAHTYGALTRILSRRPVVATAHAMSLQLHWYFNNRVIATSPAAAKYHVKVNRVSRKAIRMVPNFIDTQAFPIIAPEERRAARDTLGLPQDAFVFGTVGDVGERKRQSDLVDVLARVVQVEPRARLLLIGNQDQPYFDRLKDKAASLGVTDNLIATGRRTDVQHLLAAMDVLALSSRRETGPLAVLEAMSRGLPIVSTDVGMVSEFVTENISGHVVAIGDVDAMARHMIALAQDATKRAAMGKAAEAAVRARYDVSMLAPDVESILREASQVKNRPLLGFVAHMLGKPGE